MTEPTQTLLSLASSPWALPLLLVCCYADSVLPPVPSETFVLSLGALAVTGHGPHPALVVLVAAPGAFLGDRTAYELGRRMPERGIPFRGAARAAPLKARARQMLDDRGASCILSARDIPVGRVAVNVTAGLVGYPVRRFTAFAALGIAALGHLLDPHRGRPRGGVARQARGRRRRRCRRWPGHRPERRGGAASSHFGTRPGRAVEPGHHRRRGAVARPLSRT